MIEFKQKQIGAAIFDMDGTMFDTERLRLATIRQASKEICGTPIGQEILLGSLGLSAVRAEALAKQHNGEDYPYREIRRRADELELAQIRKSGVPVKDCLREVLERLRRSGLALAVATSSRRAIAEEYLINANVFKYFDIVICGDDVQHGKPHPEIFLKAATNLNCPIEQSLIVEDSESGLLAAARAGGCPVFIKDLKEPRATIRNRVFQAYQALPEFFEDLQACTPVMAVPKLTEPFPLTLNDRVVGIHGFGAMGGGYLAQIFSHWDGYTRPRRIIGVTGDAALRQLVNAVGKYTVSYRASAFEQTIDSIHLIDPHDRDAVSDMYARSEIVGLSMPEGAIRQQAPLIASGLVARHEHSGRELVILTVINKISGGAFVRKCVQEALGNLVEPAVGDAIMAKTRFPETMVNRIVSRVSKQDLLRQARIKLEIFDERRRTKNPTGSEAGGGTPGYPLLSAQHLKEASTLAQAFGRLHLVLFNSEPDMPVYAKRGAPILEHLRQIKTVEDIGQIQMIKNRLWNGTHAVIAWYSYILGFETIGRGMGDSRVARLAHTLVEQEIGPALLREYPTLEAQMPAFMQTFLVRCQSSFKDPCRRVGRDPLRKLQRRERIFATIDIARKHGLPSDALEFGAALGVHYALRTATPDRECLCIRELYDRAKRVEDVLTYHGPYNGAPYSGLDPEADAALISRVGGHFSTLGAEDIPDRERKSA